jgi:hypothetical protein
MNYTLFKTIRLLSESDLVDVALRLAARDVELFSSLSHEVLESKKQDAEQAAIQASFVKTPTLNPLKEFATAWNSVVIEAENDLSPYVVYENGDRSWSVPTAYDRVIVSERLLAKLRQPSMAKASKRVTSIKEIRNSTGCGLKEALDTYDWLVNNGWITINRDLYF